MPSEYDVVEDGNSSISTCTCKIRYTNKCISDTVLNDSPADSLPPGGRQNNLGHLNVCHSSNSLLIDIYEY